MGCTKAQVLMLIEYIYNECLEVSSLEKCLEVLRIIKHRAREMALNEFMREFYR